MDEYPHASAAAPAAPALSFPVVGIGASAGGFPALSALLGNMPPCPGMALVVILHLPGDQRSTAARVLQAASAMPVVEVGHSMPLLPDRVYVIPPGRSLRVDGGLLALDGLERGDAGPVAIDLFLASLAEAQGPRAIGVLLSGAGSDGAAGLARIRARGGATIVQLPGQAEHDGMPRAAIAAGVADFVLETGAIPHQLAALRDGAGQAQRPAPGTARPPSPALRRGRLFSFADIHLHKAAALAPPSILLDADGDVLHLSEAALPFVRPPGGEPTRELAALVLPELRLALRAALLQAQATGLPAATGPLCRDGKKGLDIRVQPFTNEEAGAELLLVSFHPLPDLPPASGPEPAQDNVLVRRLEAEVLRLRATLQQTVEQAEAQRSDLIARGEELQTMVEELHATADEFARRNDELLAATEILVSERDSLRRELAAASQTHDDLSNLVASSDVATLFLDRDMRIVRYTPRIASLFNVIPADVGRPLAHLTNRLDRPRLADEAAAVFETLQALETEVRDRDGRDYIVRVHPYRASGNRIAGAVMSFFDISGRRAAESALRASEARLSTVFASLPAGAGVVGCDGVLVMGNDELLRYLPTGRMPSRDEDRLKRWRAWDADGRLLGREDFPGARALRGERVVPGIEMLYTHDDGRETWAQVASSPLRDETGAIVGQVAVVTDIDAIKRSEAALRENEARLRGLVGGLAQAVWEAAPDGHVVLDSPSWRAYTGQALEEWIGEGWIAAVHPDDREVMLRLWQDAVARRAALDARYRLRRVDGRWCWSTVRAAPLLNQDGSIRKWVGMNFEAEARAE